MLRKLVSWARFQATRGRPPPPRPAFEFLRDALRRRDPRVQHRSHVARPSTSRTTQVDQLAIASDRRTVSEAASAPPSHPRGSSLWTKQSFIVVERTRRRVFSCCGRCRSSLHPRIRLFFTLLLPLQCSDHATLFLYNAWTYTPQHRLLRDSRSIDSGLLALCWW